LKKTEVTERLNTNQGKWDDFYNIGPFLRLKFRPANGVFSFSVILACLNAAMTFPIEISFESGITQSSLKEP